LGVHKKQRYSMSCAAEEQQVTITNQDSYPLTVVVTAEGEDGDNKGEILETYEVAAGRLDEETGVYERRNKIILVTARDLSNEPDREELFKDFARPDGVVYKPFELSDLLRKIEELLGE